MTTITHTVGFININSVEQVMETLNSLPNTKAYISDKTFTSTTLSIDIEEECTLQDILALGTLIGSIQTSLL